MKTRVLFFMQRQQIKIHDNHKKVTVPDVENKTILGPEQGHK
jgi:hypothetical protein